MSLPAKPSVFMPLLRRFTNERQREIDEASKLYSWVKAYQDRFRETPVTLGRTVFPFMDDLTPDLRDHFLKLASRLITDEPYFDDLAPPDFGRMNMQEFVECLNMLRSKQYFFVNQEEILYCFKDGLEHLFRGLTDALPKTAAPSPFTIPLVFAIHEPRELIEATIGFFWREDFVKRSLFRDIAKRLYSNLCAVSGCDPNQAPSKALKMPTQSNLPLDELASTYLAGTPFLDIFMAPVPLKLTHEERFSHMHVLGGSGAGKTTLIEGLIRHDLQSDNPPSLVIFDPHSDLIRRLARSDLGIEDRLILIDPRDTKYPVALNPFAMNRERFSTYDEATQEQVTAGVIQTLGYLWNGLTNLTLTGKQDVFFKYVTRLLLTLPEVEGRNATIIDMLKLMHDPTPYGRAISMLPDIPREFFVKDFMSKTFEGTKEQVRYRIQAIIESPTMARLFTSPETKVDFFTEMNRGAVILIDTAKDFLKDGSAIFGKLMVSLILQAVLERTAIPENDRKPTFIMIDEAGSVFSSNIDDLLTEARKYKAGLLLAHQYMDQGSSGLRASLAANTAIKFAAGLSAQDAGTMAREMRTTPEFLLSQPKYHFSAHIRHVTPSAVSIPIKPVSNTAQLSAAAFEELMVNNRERVSLGPADQRREPNPEPDTEPTSHRSPASSRSFYERKPSAEPPDAEGEWVEP